MQCRLEVCRTPEICQRMFLSVKDWEKNARKSYFFKMFWCIVMLNDSNFSRNNTKPPDRGYYSFSSAPTNVPSKFFHSCAKLLLLWAENFYATRRLHGTLKVFVICIIKICTMKTEILVERTLAYNTIKLQAIVISTLQYVLCCNNKQSSAT
jgi:hypothetical protein